MKHFLILLSVFFSFASYSNDKIKYTISGISSGGFMANQMATIYSSKFSGVGTVAGGFYYCAEDYLPKKIKQDALTIGTRNLFLFEPTTQMMTDVLNPFVFFIGTNRNSWFFPQKGNPIYLSTLCMANPDKVKIPMKYLIENENAGLIDPLKNIAQQKVFIYHGKADSVLKIKMQDRMSEFYRSLGTRESNIQVLTGTGGHNFPTDRKDGNECGSEEIPYVSSCDLNVAGKMLGHLLNGKLVRTTPNTDHIYVVDQNLELRNQSKAEEDWVSPTPSIAPYGYLYASEVCLKNPGRCRLHVALHGCKMSDSYNEEFQTRYQNQINTYGVVAMRKKPTLGFTSLPFIEEKENHYGLLKFVMDSGYIDYAEKNDLMVLFPQTWITEENFPYNPKGCWDWFGWTGSEYATNQGVETQWLMGFVQAVGANPRKHILRIRPEIEKMESYFPKSK